MPRADFTVWCMQQGYGLPNMSAVMDRFISGSNAASAVMERAKALSPSARTSVPEGILESHAGNSLAHAELPPGHRTKR